MADSIEKLGINAFDEIMDALTNEQCFSPSVVPYKLVPFIRAMALIGMEEVGSVLMKRKLRIINGEE
jgi:hypothetical protein